MNRLLLVAGTAVISMGLGLIVPLLVDWNDTGRFGDPAKAIALTATLFVSGGFILIGRNWRFRAHGPMPKPVRAAIAVNIVFLAFFALEFSDGILRQNGRIFYWTSILFVPALLLLYGLASGRRWAWWTARVAAALLIAWFVGFMILIPFADLRGHDGPVPWWGRVYMLAVSMTFAAVLTIAFRSLGNPEARRFFEPAR